MTLKPVEINVYTVAGSEFCVSSTDGQKVFRLIKTALERGRPATISFANVESLTSAFLNAAVGQLYGHFDEGQLRESLAVRDLAPADQLLLKRVVEAAKRYFADPKGVSEVHRQVLETV